ncbi:hypothetical protein [Parasitella parasitica]|uniref:E2 ubiquitin-conjugating enzyme n=1 Tax=Parasitella parasitica TaxID=35722 RepID=A0A0B7NCC3_9FUNG|nr:hypothetical protein [Parasitella parasitica]
MTSQILNNRLQKEIMVLERDPPPGVNCYPKDDDLTKLEAYIKGPPETPYEQGLFKLNVQIPNNYPFEPPQIRFLTRIYHPNIDDAGRICADILKKGEHGSWRPSLNLRTTLLSLSQLLANPNPDDPLDAEIAREYQIDLPTFNQKALEYTLKFANEEAVMSSTAAEQEESKVKQVEQNDVNEEAVSKAKPKLSLSLSKKKSSTIDSSQSTSSQSSLSNAKSPSQKRMSPLENSQGLEIALKKLKTLKETESPNADISKEEASSSNDQTLSTEPACAIKSKHFSSSNNTGLSKSTSILIPKQKPIKEVQVNVIKQTLANNTPQEQQQDTKRTLNKEIIILSDDEEDVAILHSFQLSRKTNRTKLSLSKRRK